MTQLMPLTLSGSFDRIAELERELVEAETVAGNLKAAVGLLHERLAPFAEAYRARLAESPQYDNHPGDVLMNATLPLAAWRAAHRAVSVKEPK
jgi:hypothetical protein